MPIRITFNGESREFSDQTVLVTAGRHPQCDVVLPADNVDVSRRHAAFERKLGRYRLVLHAENPVWVDGEEGFEGDELPAACRIAFGSPQGVEILVETWDDDGLPPTRRRPRHDSPGRAAALAVRRNRVLRRLVAVLLLAVVAGLGGSAWLRFQDRQEIAALLTSVYNAKPPPAAEETLVAGLRKAAGAVYLVVAQDQFGVTPVGTAFVAGRGVLVTTAHVAELFLDGGEGLTMLVRPGGIGGADLKVVQAIVHPQYRAFEDAWRSYGPLSAGAGGDNRPIVEAGGYDVAVLKVADADADLLAPPLALAADADLTVMEPGDPVGYVGFPNESAAVGGVNLGSPQAQMQIGHLTALTDFFLVKSDVSERHLLQHSLPVQGGASGAPMLDRRGQVVGVVSGGNLVEIDENGTRVPTGIGVNFAQRVDLVRELLSGEAEKRAADRAAQWEKRLRRYQNEVDVALADWAASHGASVPTVPLAQVEGRTAPNQRLDMSAFVHSFVVPKAGWYLFLATSRGHENIDMMVVENDEAGPRIIGMDSAPDHYPGVEYASEKGAALEIVVPGPESTDVRLRIYWLPPPQ